MTLMFIEGFEVDDHSLTAKWTSNANAAIGSAGRFGGGNLQRAGSSTAFQVTKVVAAALEHATFVIGTAIDLVAGSATASVYFSSDNAAVVHVEVRVNPVSRTIDVYRGVGTTLLGSSAVDLFPLTGYFYLEARAVMHDTTGSVEVRLNGGSTPVINLTNVDTKNAGTKAVFDAFALRGSQSPPRYDDVYALNGAGSAPFNTFLGERKVETLYPNAEGDVQQFTPSTGTTHYTLVDEATANTTDYVYSDVVDNVEVFNLPSLSGSGGTPDAVQTHLYAAKSDTGARSMNDVLRIGGTNYNGPDKVLTTGYQSYFELYTVNPATGVAWTAADIAALQVGARVR